MKAITTTYCGPTTTRSARIIARAEGVRSVTSYGDTYSDNAHRIAAQALCDKYGWDGELTEAGLPNGDRVFIFNPAITALRALTKAVVHNTMPDTNPYSRPVVKRALETLADHDQVFDCLRVVLDK